MQGFFGEQEVAHNDAPAILAYCNLHLGTTKIGKRYSPGQAPKSAANGAEWRRVLSRPDAACIKLQMISDKKKHVIQTHAQFDDIRSWIYTCIYIYKSRHLDTCSRSPMNKLSFGLKHPETAATAKLIVHEKHYPLYKSLPLFSCLFSSMLV